jgi:hypothetical protein
MYCSIQEAWPEHNFGRDIKIDNITNQNNNTSILNKNNIQQNNNVDNVANMEHYTSNITCKSFIEHLSKCSECKSKLKDIKEIVDIREIGKIREGFSFNNIIEKMALTPELKETLIVFLIGILVLLILNLLFK